MYFVKNKCKIFQCIEKKIHKYISNTLIKQTHHTFIKINASKVLADGPPLGFSEEEVDGGAGGDPDQEERGRRRQEGPQGVQDCR